MKMFDQPVSKPQKENVNSNDPSSSKAEQTSTLDPKDYVVVNIWASKENKALEGANVGHISLETRFDYISLWPGPRPESQLVDANAAFAKTKRAIYHYFGERPPSFKQDYTEDCLGEAMSEDRYREISNIKKCKKHEVAYIFNAEDLTLKPIQKQPEYLKKSEQLIAVDLCQASVRLVLYSLQVDKITSEFKSLNKSIKGWQLAGSNIFTRNLKEEATESCASLAFRCLKAGGLYSKLSSKLSSDRGFAKV